MSKQIQESFDQPFVRRAFVVVGMHRSGTSAMTRLLSLLGAQLPKRLMLAQEDNPSGFWEPQSIADLNDEILRALDSEWDDVFAFRSRDYLSNFDRLYLARALELLEEEFCDSEVIVLKDPRISVLSSFWNRALRAAGYRTHYIVMVRNPLEIADSLRVRDSFPREKSFLLWSSYMLAVDRDTRDQKRTFVAFEQLMNDWRAVRERIQVDAGLPFFRDTSAAAVEIDQFIDTRLRHHKTAADDLSSRADVPAEVKELYRIFSGACYDQDIDLAALEALRKEFEKIDALMGPVLADLRQRGRILAKNLAELERAHTEAAERVNSLADQLAAAQATGEGLSAERDALKLQLVETAKVRGELTMRESELRQRQEEIEQTRTELEQVRLERDAAREQFSGSEHRLKQEETARREAEGLAEKWKGLHERGQEELADLTTARDGLAEERARLEQKLESAETGLETVRSELEREKLVNERRITELNRALDLAQDRCREHEQRLTAHFGETAALSKMLFEREQQALREVEKVRRLRELYRAVAARPRWWAILPRSRQALMEHRRLHRLGLFDANSYLRNNPDVAESGMDPVHHFLIHGIDEDRQA
jgi:hypothetical protein